MKIKIYGKPNCSYCTDSKQFLDEKGIDYQYVDIEEGLGQREMLLEKYPSVKTVPVIEVDGVWIGGYTELKEHINENVVIENGEMLNVLKG